MAFPILGNPKPTFLDSSGNPLVSGTLSVLNPADDTNKAYYPTADDADAATNSASGDITLDSRGEPTNALFGIDDQTYKLVLKDSAAVTIWTVDDIRCPTRLPTLYGATAQTLTDAGAVTLTESTTFVVTTGAAAITLADGVENQHKLIVMKTDAGAATLTPTNLSNGTTIVFNDVGDSADLWFIDGSWNFVGGNANLTGSTETAITFDNADATPSVAGGGTFITQGTTAITDFDDGVVGDTITIFGNSPLTITNNSAINLDGNEDLNLVGGDTLTLHMFIDQVWYETSRMFANVRYEAITSATDNLTAAESGRTLFLNRGAGITVTIPAPALGLHYTFISISQPATAYTINTTSGDNIMYGNTLDIVGEMVYGSAQDIISFVASTSVVGDRVDVVSDGTSWFYTALSGANGGITTGQT